MEKLVLITGASRGIGKAILDVFYQQGFNVVATTSHSGSAATLARDYDPKRVLVLDGDLREYATTIPNWQARIQSHFERSPDIVIGNAGITEDNLLLRMSLDEWDDVIKTNLSANFLLAKTFLRPMMKNRFGRFIFLGSVSGMGNPGQINYAATKAGIQGLARTLALEYASRGITSNVIAPGYIATDMTASLGEDVKAATLTQIPMQRYGNPGEIASLAYFLASSDASYITGQTIHINGGLLTS